MIDKLPTNCALTKGNDKEVGWNNCIENCINCKKCNPDPKTNCGQMLLLSGETDCVPPKCFNQCCKNDLSLKLQNSVKNNLLFKTQIPVSFIILLILTFVLAIYILTSIIF